MSEQLWLGVGLTLPLLTSIAYFFVGYVGRMLADLIPEYVFTRATYLRGVVLFHVALAGLFLSLGPSGPILRFEWVFLLAAVVGYALYCCESRVWAWWTDAPLTSRSVDQYRAVALLAIAAAAEEVLYRGVLGLLIDPFDWTVFVATSATLFGLSHVFEGKHELLLKTVDGAIYALLYVVSGSLLVPVLAHVGYNVSYGTARMDRGTDPER